MRVFNHVLVTVFLVTHTFATNPALCQMALAKYMEKVRVVHRWDLGGEVVPGDLRNTLLRYDGRSSISAAYPSPIGKVVATTTVGPIEQVEQVAASEDVSVFFAKSAREGQAHFVVKHFHDCREKLKQSVSVSAVVPKTFFAKLLRGKSVKLADSGEVPLVKEYALSAALATMGIPIPKMRFISRLTPLTASAQWDFDWPDRALCDDCVKAGAVVRTLVENRAGPTMTAFFGEWRNTYRSVFEDGNLAAVSLDLIQDIIWAGFHTFNFLDQMHAVGAFHGDIHGGNVAFAKPGGDLSMHVQTGLATAKLVLIDLGEAGLICGNQDDLKTPPDFALALLSPWQLEGMGIRGFRDDAYRVLEMMANWFSWGNWNKFGAIVRQRNPENARAALHTMKLNLPLFGSDWEFAQDDGFYECFGIFESVVDSKVLGYLRRELGCVLGHVRSLDENTTPVDFKLVTKTLTGVLNKLGDYASGVSDASVFELSSSSCVITE